jgi:hypothetical protein
MILIFKILLGWIKSINRKELGFFSNEKQRFMILIKNILLGRIKKISKFSPEIGRS